MWSGAETTLLGKIKSTCKGKVQKITQLHRAIRFFFCALMIESVVN